MTEFWLSAGLLLLAALAFLLLPILRGRRRQQAEQDRTALNVALFEERVAELAAQQQAGVLDAEQLAKGRDEAARELLADTERDGAARQGHLGKAIPLLAAVLVPAMALGLYLHFGAADKVELTQEFAKAPQSMQEMTSRLERAVQAQPDSAEALYILGRTYMADQRPADAAKAFERAVSLAGRQPELLGQWAQALYFAADKQWSPQLQALTEEALTADPQEVTSLGLRGIAAFEGQRYQEAIGFWQRLLAQLPEGDASRAALQGGIDRAADKLKAGGAKVEQSARLKVRVELAAALKDKVRPDDTVFIFARASNGPPMPLAAKRVTVAQLPIEVELSDADAMMPQMKLSDYAEVQLVARVSRAGQPTHGEWKGQSAPLASGTQATQHLTIDSPDS
ncbi:c-type cytochrome biogenesis protein CcmI [Pseudomonas oryziphila]|uniref:C-type cytochrome biogenesis protein CcmI n=1 Tax=Pseudomonas oryziphila TaxID=2894079 RepID=A0ABM7CNX8_9PSED|nr:c-type cytochrome biogenesis protein CcmI [Pseudomonas oryziphila]AZL73135.1 c-type cytochrome biogenesis protein CcmI [Pseudomonas oryziphila]